MMNIKKTKRSAKMIMGRFLTIILGAFLILMSGNLMGNTVSVEVEDIPKLSFSNTASSIKCGPAPSVLLQGIELGLDYSTNNKDRKADREDFREIMDFFKSYPGYGMGGYGGYGGYNNIYNNSGYVPPGTANAAYSGVYNRNMFSYNQSPFSTYGNVSPFATYGNYSQQQQQTTPQSDYYTYDSDDDDGNRH